MNGPDSKGYLKIAADAAESDRSTCGIRQRLLKKADASPASLSRLRIQDARPHWHRHTHEYYYVLGGEGVLVVDHERVPLAPGDCVWIRPGHMHHAEGPLDVLIVAVPAYDPADTHFDPPGVLA